MTPARATLLSAPYKNTNGQWRAAAIVNGAPVGVRCSAEHSHLRKGDVLNVRYDGMEWRVG